MSEVPVRELNQNTAGVLARVKDGEPIDITERGTVIARIVPAREPVSYTHLTLPTTPYV